MKRHSIRIAPKANKFYFNYLPGYGDFSYPSFSPLFPSDLHKIGDTGPFIIKIYDLNNFVFVINAIMFSKILLNYSKYKLKIDLN